MFSVCLFILLVHLINEVVLMKIVLIFFREFFGNLFNVIRSNFGFKLFKLLFIIFEFLSDVIDSESFSRSQKTNFLFWVRLYRLRLWKLSVNICEIKVRFLVLVCILFSIQLFVQSSQNYIILFDHLGLLVHVINFLSVSHLILFCDFWI